MVMWPAGVACICLVAVIWTVATVLKQVVFSDFHYDEPLVLTWLCNGCYVLQLPMFLAGRALGLVESIPWRRQPRVTSDGQDALYRLAPASPTRCDRPQAQGTEASASAAEVGTSVAESVLACFFFLCLSFASQWTYSA